MSGSDIGEALLRGFLHTARPFVRRMIARGVTFGRVERRLRELFVQVADDLGDAANPPTDSRISILTGINRREVRRIRAANPEEPPPSTFTRSLIASLVSRWATDPRTTDRRGRPIALPFESSRGPSFAQLARETTRELRPRALLHTLVETGAAEVRNDDIVELTRSAYTPARGHPESLAMLAQDPPELVETLLFNVLGEGEGGETRLQQKVAYDNLGSEAMERVRRLLNREAQRMLTKSNQLLSAHDRDRNPGAPGGQRTYAGIGVYFFEAIRRAPERKSLKAKKSRSTTRRKRR